MYQQITLIGNLGRDPEMRYTPSGVPVTNFSIAVSRSWTGNDGQRQEKTVWFRVSAWQRQAETCNQYLTKGQRVLVVGEMEEPYLWTDQGGNARASLQVRARNVQFLSSRAESEALAAGAGQGGGMDDGAGQGGGMDDGAGQGGGMDQGGGPASDAGASSEEDIPF